MPCFYASVHTASAGQYTQFCQDPVLLQAVSECSCSGLRIKKTPWSEPASELYRPSDLHLLAKLVPTFADGGCHVVSVTDPNGRILGFIDRSRYFFFQVPPQLYSLG
jgi:hypothetical protein